MNLCALQTVYIVETIKLYAYAYVSPMMFNKENKKPDIIKGFE